MWSVKVVVDKKIVYNYAAVDYKDVVLHLAKNWNIESLLQGRRDNQVEIVIAPVLFGEDIEPLGVKNVNTVELFDKVALILQEHLGLLNKKIEPSTLLMGDLGADSFDIVELIMAFESDLDIEITDDELLASNYEITSCTVQNIVDMIEKKIKEKG